MILILGLLWAQSVTHVFGDLPVHCELTEVLGDWEFLVGKDVVDSPSICKPESGMNPLNTDVLKTIVSFTRMNDRSGVSSSDVVLPYVALSGLSNMTGSWSTIYDEGVVLQIIDPQGSDRLVFYGHFGFSVLDPPSKLSSPASNRVALAPSKSFCNVIPRGWTIRFSPTGQISLHCFTATRVSRLLPLESRDAPVTPPMSLRVVVPDALPISYRIPNWDFPSQSASPSQGACGSCYVLSYAYALERVAVNRLKQFGIVLSSPFMKVDREAMLSCSVSNQGCSGGFYSSLTLDLVHLGAPQFGCMDSSPSGFLTSTVSSRAQQCDIKCYLNPDELVFTRGFTELRTHDDIVDYLINYGPVPVGIYMNSDHHNSLRGGSGGNIIDLPSIPLSPGLDKLNHGVVIIGWGTEEDSKKPFWYIYNPWGGDDTFARITRNLAGGVAERNGIGIKVDTCRGLLGAKIKAAGKVSPSNCN